ncbi:hydroxymethylbilane synthase [Alteribacillus persepolensis]|uniref:Porphobilinogen deaminase n=1 Tax=Alteribacillus persepolensis TaxID=568899 RepID=A0A1G8BRG9_9BACI|nr:hydroxymethylbilane synthase [Alteribacillus persepolensis]SDH35836.1 hydroxymethylbilane synthase [Alteribacillus persepolensis]
MRTIVLGTRKSNLAMKQTEWVIAQLEKFDLPYRYDIKKIVTKGDKILDVTLSKVGGKGLFVKEIEQAMSDKEIDIAVHSMKDMPSELQDGFTIGAITNRVDPRDAYIANNHVRLEDLPAGAVVGTSSLRRSAQILAYRPDLEVKWIRGNIETRLRKLREENFDAIILASAGLERMGWSEELVTQYLDPDVSLPAVGQGALGLECREDDKEVLEILSHLNDEAVRKRVTAERAFLQAVEGGCQVPVGGYATLEADGEIKLTALVGSPDGKTILKEMRSGYDPVQVGQDAAHLLLEQGAKEILDKVKAELDGQ